MLRDSLQAIFGVLVLSVAALGAGYIFYRWLPPAIRRWERWVFALVGGWGLLSLVLYLIGQINFSRRTIFLVVSVFALGGATLLWKGIRSEELRGLGMISSKFVPAAFVLLIILVAAISGLAPVTGDWGSDTVTYHLLGPKVWLRAELIRSVPDNCHTAFPQTAETMFAALYALGGASGPCMSDFLIFGLLLATAASLAMFCGLDGTGAWWVAAIVAAMPAVYSGSHAAFVDALYAAFLFSAVRIGMAAEEFTEWVLVGLFCGLTIATKYTGLLTVPFFLASLLLFRGLPGRPSLQRALEGCLTATAFAAIVASPYYIRNWVLLGCPIYPPPPGLIHFCNAKYIPLEAIRNFHRYILARGIGLGRNPIAFLMLPFNLTYHTSNFHGAGGIGLVPLGLAPIGVFSFRKNTAVQYLALLSLLLTAVWFGTQQESRFLISVYVIAAVLGVLGWRKSALIRASWARAGAAGLVTVSLLYGTFMILKGEKDVLHAALVPSYAER